MKVMKTYFGVPALAVTLGLGLIGLTGCDSANPEATGQVQVYLSDAAQTAAKTASSTSAPDDFAAEIDSALVTIDRIELVGDTSAPAGLMLLEDDVTVNLLHFENGVDTLLANELVPEGAYTQIRFYVADATIYLNGDTEGQPLTVPSEFVRINLPEFEINEDDDLVEITLDFDVTESFVKAGSSGMYLFKPVIHPIEFTVNGVDVDVEEDGTTEGTGS